MWAHNRRTAPADNVGVDLGGTQIRVTKLLLNRADIHAPFEQMRGEGVAQRMRADAASHTGRGDALLQDACDATCRQAIAEAVQEDGAPVLAQARRGERLEVLIQRVDARSSQSRQALAPAFAAQQGRAVVQVEIREVEARQLRYPRAGGVERLQQRAALCLPPK